MAGLGSTIFCQLPSRIDNVLETENAATPVATRLACTIGPQSRSVEVLKQMLQAGMKIARFDFTYGDLAFHLESFGNLREAMQQTNTLCAVMINPAGPDIHVENRPAAPIQLTAGQIIRLTNDVTQSASSTVLPVNWPGSFTQGGLAVGSTVFIGQYLFTGAETTSAYLTVQTVEANAVQCVVNNTCTLEGVQLTVKIDSQAKVPMPCLSPKDEQYLSQWAAATSSSVGDAGSLGAVEFVALPRTRSADDVEQCRALLARLGLGHVKVVARLDDLEGLTAHESILSTSDGVIFSRGSLGTCMEPEKVFLAQKMLVRAANGHGKPIYVTRVVDTMTDAPRPTRAEATDVANLVLDGADGVLLGSETFRGKYPVDAVRTVAGICRAAEAVFDNYAFYRSIVDKNDNPLNTKDGVWDRAEALSSSTVRAAHKMDAKLIVVFTVTGRTARLLAKFKPSQPILTVVCTDPSSARFADSTYSSAALASKGSPDVPTTIKKVGSDTLLSLKQLSSWSHGTQAKACLAYRGVLPIMVDAPSGRQAGDLLEAVLDYAKSVGLVVSGDRVVVSQCPRNINSEVISEAGVVSLITVDKTLL